MISHKRFICVLYKRIFRNGNFSINALYDFLWILWIIFFFTGFNITVIFTLYNYFTGDDFDFSENYVMIIVVVFLLTFWTIILWDSEDIKGKKEK